MAPVIAELRRHPQACESRVCFTGQHRELVEPVLRLFEIGVDVDLAVMRPDQDLAALTGRLFGRLAPVVRELTPDWVLAQGDTTSVMVAALVAFYEHVRFGHVEAGLRTGDLEQPFPEELNRRVADLVAAAHFAPTERSRQALLREGIPRGRIHLCGNTVVDALLAAAALPYDWAAGPLRDIPAAGQMVLITGHRRESFGRPFEQICRAIRQLAGLFTDHRFVYPVHLNPNVRRPVHALLSGLPNLHLIEPLDYLSLVNLMRRARLILTDSGGIQEEAPTFGVPVLVMREVTERPEAVEAGLARLVGSDKERIVREAARILTAAREPSAAGPIENPYGDGRAAARIVSRLLAE